MPYLSASRAAAGGGVDGAVNYLQKARPSRERERGRGSRVVNTVGIGEIATVLDSRSEARPPCSEYGEP
jgi:hypothetical protein